MCIIVKTKGFSFKGKQEITQAALNNMFDFFDLAFEQ